MCDGPRLTEDFCHSCRPAGGRTVGAVGSKAEVRCGNGAGSQEYWTVEEFDMTQTPEKSEPRWAEVSDDVLESLEAGRKQAIEAVRRFVDQISPVLPEQSRRKTVIDAALNLAEELGTARIEFIRSVVHSASEAVSK